MTESAATERPVVADRAVAVIGLALRFPGADDAGQFWETIRDGTVHVRRFTEEDFADAGVPEEDFRSPDFVGASALLDGIAEFDAEFFGITGKEASITDPQHRLLLECCHHALEDGGYAQEPDEERIAVYASTGYRLYTMQNYLASNLAVAGWDSDWVSAKQVQVGNAADFAAARVAFRLGLTGPAISVQTACSSSLVSVHLAARALLARDADLALVGSAALHLPQIGGHHHMRGSTISPSGKIRPFDADADGTVGGNGVAAVLLKRLDKALADGDTIRAVVLGSDVSNDGSGKRGFAAPSVEGQRSAAVRALRDAAVPAESIGYLEAHGTGTFKGDPIEFAALEAAYRAKSGRTGFCELGTVKANIGHLDACAGLAGLIKAVLVLEHEELPPLAGHARANPAIGLAGSPFTVSTQPRRWPRTNVPRRAAVHSIGMGGTNAHVILQEAPKQSAARPGDAEPPAVLPLSARTDEALRDLAAAYHKELIDSAAGRRHADIVTTAAAGRRHHARRLVLLGSEPSEHARAIDDWLEHGAGSGRSAGDGWLSGGVPGEIRGACTAFLFSGQGGPHPGMARELSQRFPAFREALDECDRHFRASSGSSLLPQLVGRDGPAQGWGTDVVQPALFAFQLALTRLWESLGVTPSIVAGHSIGEYAALCAVGALSVEDGMSLTTARGSLIQQGTATGRMAAVFAGRETVESIIAATPGVELAVVNGASNHVIAGPPGAVGDALRRCDQAVVRWIDLPVDRAFHTSLLEPVLAEFTVAADAVKFQPSTLPFVSGLDGVVRSAGWIPDAEYLVRQIREPVRFDEVLMRLGMVEPTSLLEIGPTATLSALARRALPDGPPAIASQTPRTGLDTFWTAVARLYCAGVDISWGQLVAECGGRRIPLPGYPFRRTEHWAGPPLPRPGYLHRGIRSNHKEPDMPDQILHQVIELTARQLGLRPEQVRADRPYVELGADSLQLIGLVKELEHDFAVDISLRELLEDAATPALTAQLIQGRIPGQPRSGLTQEPPNSWAAKADLDALAADIRVLAQTQARLLEQLTEIVGLVGARGEATR